MLVAQLTEVRDELLALAGEPAAVARPPKARCWTPAMRSVPPMMFPIDTGTKFLKKKRKKRIDMDNETINIVSPPARRSES